LSCPEGAGILILEELEHALARNANISYAEIIGFGMTGDAHPHYRSDKEGAKRCIQQAMKDGGVTCKDIDLRQPPCHSYARGRSQRTLLLKEIFGQ